MKEKLLTTFTLNKQRGDKMIKNTKKFIKLGTRLARLTKKEIEREVKRLAKSKAIKKEQVKALLRDALKEARAEKFWLELR